LNESDRRYHEVANIFPLMQGDEYESLKADIAANGLLEPVWLHPDDHSIIDGRNRHRACIEVGKDPKFRYWDNKGSLVSFVVSLNLKRRHLNESQRAMVAAKIANMSHGGDRKSDQAANLPLDRVKQSEVATMLNIGERTIRDAKAVQAKGTPELIKAVESGKVAVSTAAKIAQAPPKEQVVIVAQGPKEVVKAANKIKQEKKEQQQASKQSHEQEIVKTLPAACDRYKLIKSAIDKLASELEPESVDVIITDPPYPAEYLSTYSDLADIAEYALKPGGSLFAMVGQSYLPEIMNRLGECLTYNWTLAYLTPGGQAVQVWQRKVNTFWKPVLWYVKGDYSGGWLGDVAKSSTNDNDKRFHHWGQSESGMADLITRCSNAGDTILDPFCGGGTTGVVSVMLNRLFVGADIDEKCIEVSKIRLAEATNAEMG